LSMNPLPEGLENLPAIPAPIPPEESPRAIMILRIPEPYNPLREILVGIGIVTVAAWAARRFFNE